MVGPALTARYRNSIKNQAARMATVAPSGSLFPRLRAGQGRPGCSGDDVPAGLWGAGRGVPSGARCEAHAELFRACCLPAGRCGRRSGWHSGQVLRPRWRRDADIPQEVAADQGAGLERCHRVTLPQAGDAGQMGVAACQAALPQGPHLWLGQTEPFLCLMMF